MKPISIHFDPKYIPLLSLLLAVVLYLVKAVVIPQLGITLTPELDFMWTLLWQGALGGAGISAFSIAPMEKKVAKETERAEANRSALTRLSNAVDAYTTTQTLTLSFPDVEMTAQSLRDLNRVNTEIQHIVLR